ncbi:MAG TPA: GSCFA domain-containing protein, partial [Chitinophagales bacterium]|nr:GSCFA domain-containing protein [Chitinophagales bacterium]
RFNDFYYFPAYELVMDDLRDYRFFAEDMLHPNYQATGYVWESLCNTMLEKKTVELMRTIDEILSAVKHRPRNPHSEAHKKFVQKNLSMMDQLEKDCPIGFAAERKQILSEG